MNHGSSICTKNDVEFNKSFITQIMDEYMILLACVHKSKLHLLTIYYNYNVCIFGFSIYTPIQQSCIVLV